MNKPLFEHAILYIDDEERSLKYFKAAFEPLATVLIASSPEEGFALFERHHQEIALVLSDHKMPNESGLELLRRIEAHDPKPLRFLVTAYADLHAAVESLNTGLIYSYLSKPWDPQELEHILMKSLRVFRLERERDILLAEKTEAVNQLLMADRVAGIGILSTGLNHHLRNALTVFRAFYDMLPYQLEDELEGAAPRDSSFWGDYYQEVGKQIERMTAMLGNLAEGAEAGGGGEPSKIRLDEVARRSAELVCREHPGISFALRCDEDLPSVEAKLEKVERMFRLLILETISVLRGQGEIEVRMGTDPEQIGVNCTILDTSEPLSDQDLKHLFDPFYVRTQRPEELGTNLLACYLTVFHHGGTIHAQRARDGRNSIEIWLPCFPASRSRTLTAGTVEELSLGMSRHSGSVEAQTLAGQGRGGLGFELDCHPR